jgi:hypothetical protein
MTAILLAQDGQILHEPAETASHWCFPASQAFVESASNPLCEAAFSSYLTLS